MADAPNHEQARRYATDASDSIPFFGTGTGVFELNVNGGLIDVNYRLSRQRQDEALALGASAEIVNRPIELMRIHPGRGKVIVTPRMTRADKQDFGAYRYSKLHQITLTGLVIDDIDRADQVFGILEQFPTGLTQHPDYGLAFERRFAPLVRTLERNGVRELVLSHTGRQEFHSGTYVLPLAIWDRLRRAMERTHRSALESASEDKLVLLHNGLFTAVDAMRFPSRVRPYKPDTVFKTVDGIGPNAELSERDQDATLRAVERHARQLARRTPEALFALEREVRSVTIDALVNELEPMLSRKSDETQWQRFFVDNPFVLFLAFGLPAAVIDDQVSIGGTGFQRHGERIVDFLCRLGLSDNIALVEIKTPSTPLLGSLYRQKGKVRPPSPHLAGAIAQVQDQREVLTRQFTAQNDTENRIAERPYAVRCLVVAGRTPTDSGDHRAFELFRNGLSDVLVVTFDELLAKLQALNQFLAGDDGRRTRKSAKAKLALSASSPSKSGPSGSRHHKAARRRSKVLGK
jgi:hypothetical protein